MSISSFDVLYNMNTNLQWASSRSWVASALFPSSHEYRALSSVEPPDTQYPSLEEKSSYSSGQSKRPSPSRIIAHILGLIVLVVLLSALLVTTSLKDRVHADPVGTTVHLSYGTYSGVRASESVNSFRGIRYAAPPLANLRWRTPAPPLTFEGTHNATAVSR